MAQSVKLWGATYSNVPAILVPKSTSGTARFTDASVTTATESDVASGKIFIKADGSQGTGTASGGGGSGYQVASTTKKMGSSNATQIQFTGLSGQPHAFMCMLDQQSSLGSTRYVIAVTYDGEKVRGTWGYSSSNTRYAYYSDSYFSQSYSSGTLTISTSSSSNGGYFRSNYTYRLIYVY